MRGDEGGGVRGGGSKGEVRIGLVGPIRRPELRPP